MTTAVPRGQFPCAMGSRALIWFPKRWPVGLWERLPIPTKGPSQPGEKPAMAGCSNGSVPPWLVVGGRRTRRPAAPMGIHCLASTGEQYRDNGRVCHTRRQSRSGTILVLTWKGEPGSRLLLLCLGRAGQPGSRRKKHRCTLGWGRQAASCPCEQRRSVCLLSRELACRG